MRMALSLTSAENWATADLIAGSSSVSDLSASGVGACTARKLLQEKAIAICGHSLMSAVRQDHKTIRRLTLGMLPREFVPSTVYQRQLHRRRTFPRFAFLSAIGCILCAAFDHSE